MEIIAAIISFFVQIIDGALGVIELMLLGEKKAADSSRVGESPIERNSRCWWERIFRGWFWIVLGLGLLMAILCWWW